MLNPVFYKLRLLSHALKERIVKKLDCLQEAGVIVPVQFSDWAAPVVPVVKSDGSMETIVSLLMPSLSWITALFLGLKIYLLPCLEASCSLSWTFPMPINSWC